jgi:hypothetical protein
MEELQMEYPRTSQYDKSSPDFDQNFYMSREDHGALGMILTKKMTSYYSQGLEQPQLTAMNELKNVSNSRLGGEMFKVSIELLKHAHLENCTNIIVDYNRAIDGLNLSGQTIYCPIQLFNFMDNIACMSKLQCPKQTSTMAVQIFTATQAHQKMIQYILCAYQPGMVKDTLPESYTEQLVKLSTDLRQAKDDKADTCFKMIHDNGHLKKHIRDLAARSSYKVEDNIVPDELRPLNLRGTFQNYV